MKFKILIIGILGIFFVACGGGGSSSTPTDSPPIDNTFVLLQGKVIDGEISGATVFLDLNRNTVLDMDEPTAMSDGNGTFTLTLTAEQKNHKNYFNKKAPIVIYGGVDIRTGEAFDDYLTAIIDEGNFTNVTPLSTLIAETLGEALDNDVNNTLTNIEAKMKEIKENLADLLDINKALLTKDPIDLAKEGDMRLIDISLQLHKVAKRMKRAMKKEVKNLERSILKSYRAMAKSLEKLKKSSIKSGDTALVTALDAAFEDNTLFDDEFKETIKEESKNLSKDIRGFWQRNRVALSDNDITNALNGIEIIIKDVNSSIVNDTEAPKIIRLGRKNIKIVEGNSYEDRGAIARDNKDGNVTGSIITNNPVDTSTVGTYTITYDVSDAAANKATQVTRTVRVMANSGVIETYDYLPKNITDKTAINFLSIATFGATPESIEALKNKGIERWVNEQLAFTYEVDNHLRRTIRIAKKIAPSDNIESVSAYITDNDTVFNKNVASFSSPSYQMTAWFQTVLFDENQLQHRVAYALSQIVVESLAEPLFKRRGEALASYFDILSKNALGNYRDLLVDISHSASMGLYLTYNGSKKEKTVGSTVIYPDENYARELMQLFTIGLSELNLDGTEKTDALGNSIPTYMQRDVNELAKVFTGWDLKRSSRFGRVASKDGDVTHPLEFTAEHHDFGAKSLLGQSIQGGNDGKVDIAQAIDILMAHSNVAPFISKQLIMRLVKSNPTTAYVSRVATVFNDNGQGVKGDLKAVVKAILLDSEVWEVEDTKKFKEPLLAYTEFLRAFNVQNLPVWRTSKTGIDINNAVYFRDPSKHLGQGASRAFTVFNFYENNYIPNDINFKEAGLHAPELQIQTDSMLIAFSNKILEDLRKREKRYLLKQYGTLSNIELLITKSNLFHNIGVDKFLLDCQEEYAVMEEVLEGSSNGTFKSFNGVSRSNDTTADANGETNRDRALKALISSLDNKLLAGTLEVEKQKLLFESYKEVFYRNLIRNADDPTSKIYETIILPVIMAIVTSENFMVQE